MPYAQLRHKHLYKCNELYRVPAPLPLLVATKI
nr:MAG TPA: hypothetical protein [Caudoviricetes sp.]